MLSEARFTTKTRHQFLSHFFNGPEAPARFESNASCDHRTVTTDPVGIAPSVYASRSGEIRQWAGVKGSDPGPSDALAALG